MSVRRRASGRAHYNYFRDYDPAVGRYVQCDPIGLRGGVNTFAYAFANPLWYFDEDGREAGVLDFPRRRPPIPWGRILGQAGKFAGRAVPGLGWAILAYDVCSMANDYLEKKKCEEAEDECFEECKHLLAGDRMNQGTPYRSCRIACLKRKGCYKGDMAVE